MKKRNIKKAAALKYKKERLKTPVIAAIGSGEIAKKIIDAAQKNGITIVEDRSFFNYEDLFYPGSEIPFDTTKSFEYENYEWRIYPVRGSF